MHMPHLLGLTGGIACGKTTVGKQLLDLGAARYIDADALVHELYEPGQSVSAAVVAAFGAAVRTPKGQIDRRALGAIVFSDPEQMRRLEAIVHPAVEALVMQRLADLPAEAVAVVDAVKLLEGGLGHRCDAVWLVVCPVAQQRRRLIADRHLTPAEADARLAAQPDEQARRALVDVVIDNSGTLAETRAQVVAAWTAFRAKGGLE
jgi:dephospho-CoA kinase